MAKTANLRFRVLRPWYGLSTLSTKTLDYFTRGDGAAMPRRPAGGTISSIPFNPLPVPGLMGASMVEPSVARARV